MAIADYPRYSLLASVLDASPDDALCALGALPDVVAARRFAERQSVRSGSAGLSGESSSSSTCCIGSRENASSF